MNCPSCNTKMHSHMNGTYKSGDTWTQYKCPECGKFKTIKDGAPSEEKSNGKKLGISINEIIKTHDVDELLKQGLKKLERGTLFTESEFVDLSGLRGKNYRTTLDSPEMRQYKGRIDGVTYYGIPTDIEDLKTRYIMR